MSNALVVVFHNSSFNKTPLFRILWEYFKLELLKWPTFNKIYLGDNGFGFTGEDIDWLRLNRFNYQIVKCNTSAEEAINQTFAQVKEGIFLLIHADTFIYNPEIIRRGFSHEEGVDQRAIFDGSGKELDFPILRENEMRGPRSRLCNYLWFGYKNPDINWDFTMSPSYPECASYITEQILRGDYDVMELQDDRSNILYDGKEITRSQWLDAPNKPWGSKYPLDLGYYHVRNFSGGFEIVNDFYNLKESYNRRKEIMPLTEILRILAWEKCIADKANQQYFLDDVIDDLGLTLTNWNYYLEEFKKFYPWLL